MSKGLRNKSFEKLEILFNNNFSTNYDLGLLLKYKGDKRQIENQVYHFLRKNKDYFFVSNKKYFKSEIYKRLCDKRQFNPEWRKILKDLHYLQYEIKTGRFTEQEWAIIGTRAYESIDYYAQKGVFKFKDYDLGISLEFYNTGKILLNFIESRKLGYDYKKMLLDRYKEMQSKLPKLKKKYGLTLHKNLVGAYVMTLKKGHLAFVNTDFQKWCEENELYIHVYDKEGVLIWEFDESVGLHLENPAIVKHPESPKYVEQMFQDTSLNGYRVPQLVKQAEVMIDRQDITEHNNVLMVETLQGLLTELKQMREDYYRFDILRRTLRTKEDIERHKDKFNLLAQHEREEILRNIV